MLLQSDSITIREAVKNEPEDYVNEEEDPLGQQQQQQQQQPQQQIATEDIKLDGFTSSSTAADESADYNIGSENISNRNPTMQQLQDTFSFIPMAQSSSAGFMPHSTPGSSDHSRSHPSFSLEGVQGKIYTYNNIK